MTTKHTITVTVTLLITAVALMSAPVGAQETSTESNVTQTVESLKSDLDEALELYKNGERQKALDLVHDSHHENWEDPGYESELSRIDPGLVASLEKNIHEKLPSQMENNASPEEVENTTLTVQSQLDEAAAALTQESEPSGSDSESNSGVSERVTAIKSSLDMAVEKYESSNSSAAKQVITDAYYENFEVIEGRLIEEDPEAVEEMEAAFNEELPGLIDQNASVEEVESKVSEMKSKLDEAETVLSESSSDESVSEFVEDGSGESDSSQSESSSDGSGSEPSSESSTDAETGETGSSSTSNANSLPGFGVGVAALALISVAALARRR